jgi:hypothetical protein
LTFTVVIHGKIQDVKLAFPIGVATKCG